MNGKRLPKFCNKCGRELLITEVNHEYDIYTGEPVSSTKKFVCPNYKKTIRGDGNGHYWKEISVPGTKVIV